MFYLANVQSGMFCAVHSVVIVVVVVAKNAPINSLKGAQGIVQTLIGIA